MRVVGLVASLGALLLCASLRAEPRGPGAAIAGPTRAGSPKGAAVALEKSSSPANAGSKAPPSSSVSSCAVSGTEYALYHRDVAIDGWIAARELEILPRGELVEQSVSKYVAPSDKRLAMRADGQLHRAPSDLPLYGKADHKQPPIGSVTKDTEVYVLDVVVGWASVLPKQLDVVPIGDRHFWVRATELGL